MLIFSFKKIYQNYKFLIEYTNFFIKKFQNLDDFFRVAFGMLAASGPELLL